jgi:hypothetical protein
MRGLWRIVAGAALVAGIGPWAADATPTVRLSGPESRSPIEAGADGRFSFPDVPLRRNSVNRFTVTARDDAGREYSKEIAITQLSLESVVVAKVRSEPLPPERVIELVNDGVIDVEDPANFNVSLFQIVLTIGREEIPIEVPIVMPPEPMEPGFENIPLPNDPGSGRGNSRPPDTEIVVFDKIVPCETCIEPPRIPGVIVIEGRIKSLKEFYGVRLLLMNLSGLFTLSDVKASLEFPTGGLSNTLPADGLVAFDDIGPGSGEVPGQAEREFIIRGDEIGTRPIRVNFGGVVRGPGISDDDPVPFNGSAETSVEVKGPPEFLVRVSHPDTVEAGVPYDLKVEITNNGQAPALFASLDLDIGADAEFVSCTPPATPELAPTCEEIEGPITRQLQHLLPAQRATESFFVRPKVSGDITSCVGVSSQNVTLQVLVGSIGCLTGKVPSTRGVAPGVPTVSVVPYPDALGVGIDSPVTAFFSEKILLSTLTLGENGSFRVFDGAGNIVPGRIRTTELNGDTVVIWQVEDGITNRLAGNSLYQVHLSRDIQDEDGDALSDAWTSQFRTTDPNDDRTPPQLTLGFEPGIDPLQVLPGQIVQLNAYAADQGTGVSRIELRLRDQDHPDAVEEFVDQKTKFGAEQGPTIFPIETSRLAPGHVHQLRVTAIDRAGNAQDATLPFVMGTVPVPPAITLPDDPTAAVVQGISVPVTPASVSTSIRRVRFHLDGAVEPFATVTLAPFQASVATTPLSPGEHVVRAVAEDGFGATAEDELVFSVAADTTPPVIAFVGVVAGSQFVQGTRFSVSGTATHPTGIRESRFHLDDPSGPPIVAPGGAVSIETGALAIGAHRLYLVATNALGISNDPQAPGSFLEFEVRPVPNGPPPSPPVLSTLAPPDDGKVTLSGVAPAGSRVDVRNATDGTSSYVFAGSDGRFEIVFDADPGDVLEASVLDVSQSQQPSSAASVTVPAPRVLVALQLLPSAVTLVAVNASQSLTVTGFYADGGSENLTSKASLVSSDASVASVGSGVVVAKKRGSATITASFGGLSDTMAVSAEIVTLESISVSPAQVTLAAIGATRQLVVTGSYSDGTTATLVSGLSFSSSAPTAISVDPTGRVRALTAGSALVTVAASGLAPVQVPVAVDASADLPPTVSMLAPLDGADVERGEVVSVVAAAGDETGVSRIVLTVAGAANASEIRPVSPPQASTQQTFTFTVPADAPLGSTIGISVQAEDTSGKLSPVASRSLDVVDGTPPQVSVGSPVPDTLVHFGDVVTVTVGASDAGGVSEIRYVASGALSASGTQPISPSQTIAGASFSFTIPFGGSDPNVTIQAFARDASGNEAASAPVPIVITDADVTPPATVATAASDPGSGASSIITFEVTDGLADLDHVLLYFRRNGIGSFNRYTGPDGTGSGEYEPQAGAVGTIVFDSTRSGGDGSYEFFTVGVDRAGNREPVPTSGGGISGDPEALASFATGAEVVTITTPTEIVGAALDGRNLRIVGTTVTLEGSHAFANVELLGGAVLTHRETTASEAYAIELSAWTLAVDAASRIDVVGRGHLGGGKTALGETAQTAGFAAGARPGSGGSYGGLGGDYAGNGASAPNPVYGNLLQPVDLGSGGGAWSGAGGDGGGRVLLGVLHLALDGEVLANGGLSSGSASGEGSGGSVNVSTRTLSGAGAILANGGTTGGANHVGGGGGRVAIRYLDVSTFDPTRIAARGGDGYYGDGADGTVFLLAEGEANGELVINGNGASSSFTDLLIPPGQVFDSITLQNGARVIAQGVIEVSGTLRLAGGSTLTHPSGSEAGLSIRVGDLVVESASAIDVTGRGYPGGDGSGFGSSGQTLGAIAGAAAGTGGSHGGAGGVFAGNGGALSNALYGDPKRPDRLGAGGGSWGGPGAAGGGRIHIVAARSVMVNGSIRANGALSQGSASGEGAGGSIWIETSRLGGSGRVSADGGTTGGGNHVGGGGGRVAIELEFIDPTSTLGDLANVTALGGDGYYGDGSAGTVFLRFPGQDQGTLRIDGGQGGSTTSALASELTPIGPGTTAAATETTLTVDGVLRAFTPNALVGLRVSPDTTQTESFEIAANDATTITVVTPNENGVAFGPLAGAGKRYAGTWIFDRVDLVRGGFLEVADPLVVEETLALSETSVLTHPRTTTSYAAGLDLRVGALTIDATSRIDATGRGHLGGDRAGLGAVAHAPGFAAGAEAGTGGSHAGTGGVFASNGGGLPNPAYGNPADPNDLGAGGGSWGGPGGDGGGRIRIVADAIALDGWIAADGGRSSGSASGNGSGGSVNLRTGSLSGSGFVTASGGTDGGGNHVGGGGGRVAIRYTGTLSLPRENVRALAGDGYYGDGGHGTVYFQSPAEPQGEIVVDGLGFAAPANSTGLPGGVEFSNLTLGAGVRVVADDGLRVVGTLRIRNGAVLEHSAQHEAGLQLEVGRLEVEAGGAIEVSGRGYLGGDKTGLGATAHTLGFAAGSEAGTGGSHGGAGGRYASNGGGSPGGVFGDARRPIALGGGGGAWGGPGGDGGGAIRITASEAVVVDGAIRANGAVSSGSASGEGAGGSIWIETPLLSGIGRVSADGGTTGGGNHVGGGGGRVAIYAGSLPPEADLDDLRSVTARGGDGYYGDGAAGTVFAKLAGQTEGTLYVDGSSGSGLTWTMPTPISAMVAGGALATSATTLTIDSSLRTLVPGALVGLRLFPDLSQDESFEILGNTGTVIEVITPNENGVAFAALAGAGKRYGEDVAFDSVVTRSGGHLELTDRLRVLGTLAIVEGGLLTHAETTTSYAGGLEIEAGTLLVDTTGRIDVSGRGHLGGDRTGLGETAHTVGFAPGAEGGAGGSYGGLGGDYSGNGSRAPNPVYGIASEPFELGSGGGAWSGAGGDGGGRIRVVADAIVLDGQIRADGAISSGTASGEGSGGSVNLRTGTLSGAGSISASGGTTGGATHVGGGGGRIAIRSTGTNTLATENLRMAGGDGYYGDGSPGSIFVEGP